MILGSVFWGVLIEVNDSFDHNIAVWDYGKKLFFGSLGWHKLNNKDCYVSMGM